MIQRKKNNVNASQAENAVKFKKRQKETPNVGEKNIPRSTCQRRT